MNTNEYTKDWGKSVAEWQNVTNKMVESVENMILKVYKEFCPNGDDDKGFLDISNQNVKIHEYDGELEYNYDVKYINIEEDNTIVIISEDDYGNEDSCELWDLSHNKIYAIGCAFNNNFNEIMGIKVTYQDMVNSK